MDKLTQSLAELVGRYGWHRVFYGLAEVAGFMGTPTTNQLEHDLNQMGNVYHEIVSGARAGMGSNYTRERCADTCVECGRARRISQAT
jgi:hypothetical protein